VQTSGFTPPLLASAAQSYSQAMVAQRFFDHVSPAGQTLDDRLASYVGTTGIRSTGDGIADGSPQGGLPAVSATYVSELGARGSAAPAQPTELRASASSAPRPVAERVSAQTKKQISKRCHSVARRTKGTRKARTTRFDRCVSEALRAAAR